MAEKENQELIQNLLNQINSLQERVSHLEETVSQLQAKPTSKPAAPKPAAAKPANAFAVTRTVVLSRSRKRPVSRPTVTYRVDPTSSGNKSICSEPGCKRVPRSRGLCSMHYQRLRYKERKIEQKQSSSDPLPPPPATSVRKSASPNRVSGGTRGIFAILYDEKGRRILSTMINQIKYAREDLTKRVNSQYKDMPGVPLEDDDVLRIVHYHTLGEALAKKEGDIICRQLTKQKGSLFKTAQKLKMTVEKLQPRIKELNLADEMEKIRIEFCEEILEQSSFAERLDLALTKDKYLIDLGIEDEVDASLRKELDELLSKLDDKLNLEHAICQELSLDEERYQRLVKRFEIEQLSGNDLSEKAASGGA
ncbi:MAG: hypothetical protein JRJ87_06115 [Deltaproteobacteria bacterium]|nr:hypothetical protein [Deltaproteobacteria bacterium]